jgi:hypothetical protein
MITLGIFLKILGFFIVLYSFSEAVPNKVAKAEQSLQHRFNINIKLPTIKSGMQATTLSAVQNIGRSYDEIESDLKTQIDLFSTERAAHSNELILKVPADQVLTLNGQIPKSPEFDKVLVKTLNKNKPQGAEYHVAIVGTDGKSDAMMRGLGDFAQTMVADNYPEPLVTIGYDYKKQDTAMVEFHIQAVQK